MTLHEAIENILESEGKPLSVADVVDRVNRQMLYVKKDGSLVTKEQVRARVNNYRSLFDYVDGYIYLTSNKNWRSILSAYRYLTELLRSNFGRSDLQFMIAAFFFIKRLCDQNQKFSWYHIQMHLGFVRNLFYDMDLGTSSSSMDQLRSLDEGHKSIMIFSDFGQLLSRLDYNKRNELYKAFEQLNTSHFSEAEFGTVFEYFLHLISSEFSNSTIPYTPKYLQVLMATLLKPESGDLVYDPVCGSGGLIVESLKIYNSAHLEFKGTEVNHRMAQLCFMNLSMNGFFSVEIEVKDCLTELNFPNTYDCIIGDLPLNGFNNSHENTDLFQRWNLTPPSVGKGYSAPVLFVMSKLSQRGKAVITVSDGFLFKGGREKEVRKILVENDWIESIISLPHGALRPYTEAKASILVLNKGKQRKGKINFIETSITHSNSKSLEVEIYEAVNYHFNPPFDGKSKSRLVPLEKIRKDYNLSVATYNAESLDAEEMLTSNKGRLLGELVHIRSGTSPKREETGVEGTIPIIKIENLSGDILDLYLDISTSKQRIGFYGEYSRSILVDQEAILIARLGENLKPTYFKPTGQESSILFHSGIFALVPKAISPAIDLEYLYYQLHSDFVLKQIASNRSGAVMPHISIERLKNIVIPYAPVSVQKEIVATQKANIVAAERAKVNARIEAIGYKEEIEQKESDIVRTLVHELKPKFVGIDTLIKKIKRISDKHKLGELTEYDPSTMEANGVDIDLKDLLEKPENHKLSELLLLIQKDSLGLNEILKNVQQVMSLSLSRKDFIKGDILEFLKTYADNRRKMHNPLYEIDVKGHSVVLSFHRSSFGQVLDQLFENVERHGFKGLKARCRVEFKVREDLDRQIAIIEYNNNGAPFKLTQKEYVNFLTKQKQSEGMGIGGYLVNRIIQNHGGRMTIKENYDKGFSMTIELPLSQEYE